MARVILIVLFFMALLFGIARSFKPTSPNAQNFKPAIQTPAQPVEDVYTVKITVVEEEERY